MDSPTPQNVLKALGFGMTHLIETKPVMVGGERPNCQVIYLYEAMGDEGLSIFGLEFDSGTDQFGDAAWCGAAYDAMDELAAVRPAGVPLGFLLCTPMQRPDPDAPDVVRGFWYGIGMELQQGLKITITEMPDGPFVVKPVQQDAMTGMLDQLSESCR
jgi:hypothetical protein